MSTKRSCFTRASLQPLVFVETDLLLRPNFTFCIVSKRRDITIDDCTKKKDGGDDDEFDDGGFDYGD